MRRGMFALGIVFMVLAGALIVVSLDIMKPELVADSDVFERIPDHNHGSQYWLTPDNRYAGSEVRTFIMFDVDIPTNITIDSAEFAIWIYMGEGNVSVHKVLGEWGEYEITWNNQPAFDPTPIDSNFDWTKNPVKFDITSLAKEWQSGGANYGLTLVADDNSRATFYSKANESLHPSLRIRYTDDEGQKKQVDIDDDDIDTTDTTTGQKTQNDIISDMLVGTDSVLILSVVGGLVILGMVMIFFSRKGD